MRVSRAAAGEEKLFIISDLDPRYRQAALDLYFTEVDGAFVRRYQAEAPHLEQSYRKFEQVAEAMILQTAGEQSVPWEQALEQLLTHVGSAPLDWFVCGSTALAVRGIPVHPRDIDLAMSSAAARQFGDLLADDLIQPIEDASGWICEVFGRAFTSARIEWVGGVFPAIDQPEPSDFGPIAAAQLETIAWRGHTLHIPPLKLQLDVTLRRGLSERADLIRQAMR